MTRSQMLRKVTYYDPEIGSRLKKSKATIEEIKVWLPKPDTREYEKRYNLPY